MSTLLQATLPGRQPQAIRRLYNLMGLITEGPMHGFLTGRPGAPPGALTIDFIGQKSVINIRLSANSKLPDYCHSVNHAI